MKRRVEISIEHREISVFSSFAPSRALSFHPPIPRADATLPVPTVSCPTCGSQDLVLLTAALTRGRVDFTVLNKGMQEGRIHCQRSPSGEWWLCIKSLGED